MKGFEIFNSNGQNLTMLELDTEVADLWGVSVDKKNYASPIIIDDDDKSKSETRFKLIQLKIMLNWFDIIGRAIADSTNGVIDWDSIKFKIKKPYDDAGVSEEDIMKGPYVKPFFDVINMWQSKGYVAKSVM